MSGRSNRSPMWTFFDLVDKEHAKCKKCGKIVKRAGGTTNIRNHLKNNHFSFFYEIEQTRSLKRRKKNDESGSFEGLDTDDDGLVDQSYSALTIIFTNILSNFTFIPLWYPGPIQSGIIVVTRTSSCNLWQRLSSIKIYLSVFSVFFKLFLF